VRVTPRRSKPCSPPRAPRTPRDQDRKASRSPAGTAWQNSSTSSASASRWALRSSTTGSSTAGPDRRARAPCPLCLSGGPRLGRTGTRARPGARGVEEEGGGQLGEVTGELAQRTSPAVVRRPQGAQRGDDLRAVEQGAREAVRDAARRQGGGDHVELRPGADEDGHGRPRPATPPPGLLEPVGDGVGLGHLVGVPRDGGEGPAPAVAVAGHGSGRLAEDGRRARAIGAVQRWLTARRWTAPGGSRPARSVRRCGSDPFQP
jgi:hypothetical protein